jgi:hypothetical protein
MLNHEQTTHRCSRKEAASQVGSEIDSCCRKQLVVQSSSGPHGELGASRNSPGAASRGEVEAGERRSRRCRSASSYGSGGGVADSGTSPSRLPHPTPSPWKRRNRSSPRVAGRGAADAGGVRAGGGRRGRRVRLVVGVAVPLAASRLLRRPLGSWLPRRRLASRARPCARRRAPGRLCFNPPPSPRPRRGT